MKTTSTAILLLSLLFFDVVAAFADGATFWLRNRRGSTLDAPVFDSNGTPLEGPRYRAELYGGPTPGTLKPAVRAFTNNRMIVPFSEDGYFLQVDSLDPAIRNVPWWGFAWLQLRAWDSHLGETYEEVAERGLGGYGESPLFYAQGGSPTGLPYPLIGLQSFRLRPATAVLLRGIRREGSEAVIEWLPGFARYQLQSSSELSGPWQNVGEPTTGTTLRISLDSQRRFFRVVGMIE